MSSSLTILMSELRPAAAESTKQLLRELLALAVPVWIEQVLHMLVGLNDTYLANHLPVDAPSAGAAVGTITYVLWFIGLLVGSVGVGSAALIARGTGARHRRLVNRVTGQSVAASVLIGIFVGIILYLAATPIIRFTQLQGPAFSYAHTYLRLLSVSLPFTMLMFIGNSCLRGGGDTVTPAVLMVIVDLVNMLCSFALCRGWFGLPVMGFNGIAIGTIIAYVIGGFAQAVVLTRPGSVVRLHLHRMRPHVETIRRLLRVGLPAGVEGLVTWFANFGVVAIINRMDATNVSSSAHMNTVRIESISFLSGMAFATAAATMVGTSLGRNDPSRAKKAAHLAMAAGGSAMGLMGLCFILFGRYPAQWLSPDNAAIVHLTTSCLFITGFIQIAFAANLIFGGALRGAGDTMAAMVINLSTVVGLRFTGVIVVGLWLHWGLVAVWAVLVGELFIRGCLIWARFEQGHWKTIKV